MAKGVRVITTVQTTRSGTTIDTKVAGIANRTSRATPVSEHREPRQYANTASTSRPKFQKSRPRFIKG